VGSCMDKWIDGWMHGVPVGMARMHGMSNIGARQEHLVVVACIHATTSTRTRAAAPACSSIRAVQAPSESGNAVIRLWSMCSVRRFRSCDQSSGSVHSRLWDTSRC
jgi:hypothetical protein